MVQSPDFARESPNTLGVHLPTPATLNPSPAPDQESNYTSGDTDLVVDAMRACGMNSATDHTPFDTLINDFEVRKVVLSPSILSQSLQRAETKQKSVRVWLIEWVKAQLGIRDNNLENTVSWLLCLCLSMGIFTLDDWALIEQMPMRVAPNEDLLHITRWLKVVWRALDMDAASESLLDIEVSFRTPTLQQGANLLSSAFFCLSRTIHADFKYDRNSTDSPPTAHNFGLVEQATGQPIGRISSADHEATLDTRSSQAVLSRHYIMYSWPNIFLIDLISPIRRRT